MARQFDDLCGTLGLEEAARRLGFGRTLAYDLAHKVDENGDLWLVPGHVRILKIGGKFRVPAAQVEAVLAPVERAS